MIECILPLMSCMCFMHCRRRKVWSIKQTGLTSCYSKENNSSVLSWTLLIVTILWNAACFDEKQWSSDLGILHDNMAWTLNDRKYVINKPRYLRFLKKICEQFVDPTVLLIWSISVKLRFWKVRLWICIRYSTTLTWIISLHMLTAYHSSLVELKNILVFAS